MVNCISSRRIRWGTCRDGCVRITSRCITQMSTILQCWPWLSNGSLKRSILYQRCNVQEPLQSRPVLYGKSDLRSRSRGVDAGDVFPSSHRNVATGDSPTSLPVRDFSYLFIYLLFVICYMLFFVINNLFFVINF